MSGPAQAIVGLIAFGAFVLVWEVIGHKTTDRTPMEPGDVPHLARATGSCLLYCVLLVASGCGLLWFLMTFIMPA